MKKIAGSYCIKVPFTRDLYIIIKRGGLSWGWLAHGTTKYMIEYWTQCDWRRDSVKAKCKQRRIDQAVFKPVEKPAVFTEGERAYFHGMIKSEQRSKLFLEEEGGNMTIGGPNDVKLQEEAVKRFNARHPEFQ